MRILIAYVDPGTGLLLWQAIVSAFVGAIFYVKKTRTWVFRGISKVLRLKGGAEAPKPVSGDYPAPVPGQIVSATQSSDLPQTPTN